MQLINSPDKSLIPKWEIEVQDWPGDSNWIARGAINQYKTGSYKCTVAIDDMNSLTAISTYKTYDTQASLKEMGVRLMNKKDPKRLHNILMSSDFKTPEGKEEYKQKIDDALVDYPLFEEEFISKLPPSALLLEALAGIGVGGAGNILRYLISQYKFIYLEMFMVKQNLGFYKHFGFKRLLNTKYMYLLS